VRVQFFVLISYHRVGISLVSLSLAVLMYFLCCFRINKRGSQKDMEQKKNGNYFFYDDGNEDDDDGDFDDI